MNLHGCLKKMGLGQHEAAIIRALIKEEKGAPQEAAKAAIKRRLEELHGERQSVHEQAQQKHSAKQNAQTKVEEASKEAAHSPENDRPLPTEAQHAAGNYPKGHVNLFGLNISIENPKGSVRAGVSEGKPWQVKMQNPYGYIRKTEGADGDHVDVYLGNHLTEDAPVFVVDQIDPKTSKYDEAKTILGARGYAEAKDIYDNHFADDSGESRRGAISKMSLEQFKEWLKGDTTKPVKYKEPKEATPKEIVPPESATPLPTDSAPKGAPANAEITNEPSVAQAVPETPKVETPPEAVTEAPPVAAISPERQQTSEKATEPETPAETTSAPPAEQAKPAERYPYPPMMKGGEKIQPYKNLVVDAMNGDKTYGEVAKALRDSGLPQGPILGMTNRWGDAITAEQQRWMIREPSKNDNPDPFHLEQAKATERYAGMYGKGMTEFNAKQQQKRLATERPELDWKVEEAPQYGDQRFDVAGYDKPKFSRADQTQTPEFKKWFGDSKVVDADGKPLVVYHGTGNDFSQFSMAGRKYLNGLRTAGASWFTPEAKQASWSAEALPKMRGESEGAPSVYPVYLSLKNPLIVKPNELSGSSFHSFGSSYPTIGERSKLLESGFDGLIISPTGKASDASEILAFHPEQIKSAIGNKGTFDATNPDITFNRGEGQGIPRETLDRIVSRVRESFPNAAEVETLGSTSDAPQGLIDHIKRVGGEESVQAAWWNGKVYAFAENLGSEKDAEFAILHEFGHDGLRKLFGPGLDPVLRSVYDGSIKVQLEVAKLRRQFPDLSVTQATEEHLANVAGSGERPSWMGQVIAHIRDYLRSKGFISSFSDNDILNIVHASKGALTGQEPVSFAPAFSRKAIPDWVEKMSPEAQEALRKAGVWTPKQTLKERFTDLKSEAGQKILQGTLDQFAPVLKKIGDYPYKLLRMASSADAGLEASLEYGRLKLNSVGALETMKGTKGFLEVMKPLQGEADRFLSWVAGNRAEQLSKEDREHLFGQTDIQELKKLNSKTHAADNFADGTDGAKRSEVYQKVLKDYNEFSKSILDIAEQSGIIDGEKRALWEKEFYVPFFREAEEKVTGPGNLSGMVNQYAFKKLKGGEQPLHDLLANTMQNWSHLLNASLKNNAARETLEQGAKLGIAHEVNPHETAAADKPVYILKNGEKVHYVVTDPLVLDAVSSLGASPFKGPIMDALGKMKNILTVGTTSSPVFRLRHTIREQITALAANPTTYNFVKNWIDGFKYSSRNNPEYGNMLAGGGFFRMGMSLQDQNGAYVKRLLAHGVDAATVLDTPDKVKEALKGAWDWWKETGERSDSITRANIYRQVYASLVDKVGSDKAHFEAAYAARDVMDYGLRGTWPALRMITQAVPFMNARMQGLYKLGRGAAADPKRFSAVVGGITLATIALSLAYRNDKDFQEREEWDRDNNWWFKIGDKAVRIPKPFELGAIATVADRALETAMNGFDTESRERFVRQVMVIAGSQLNLNPVPQAIWPIIQTWANKDVFTGRTIESQRDQNITTENRVSPNTSGTARLLGKAGVLSPEQIDFLVNAYFGWVGSHVVATADLALRPAMGLPDKPTPKTDDYFIVGDFVKDMPSNQSRFVEQFYDHLKTTQQAFGDMRMYQQTGQAEAAKQAAQTANVQLAGMYRQAMTTIGHINQQVRLIQAEEIDPDEKRQKLDKLYQMRNAIARSVETTRNARL